MSPAFSHLVDGRPAELSDVFADVDRFAAHLAELATRSARLIVMTWIVPRLSHAFSALAMRQGVGLRNVVMRMNLRLAERVDEMPGVVLIDASGWIAEDRSPEEAKLWYAAKIPFGRDVFRRAARDVKSTLQAASGRSRKLIVVDLDNTLWGGIVGEVGWSEVRLGGHDAVGEAFVDFQRTLLALSRRGVLLAVASKNEEAVALEAMARHPEMIVRPEQLAAWRINWQDKAANIAAIAAELNLGLGSVVFIDDNPGERLRVREALPEVLVPEWPLSPILYVDALLALKCFDTVALTDEDRARADLYSAERARTDARQQKTVEEWRRDLQISVEIEELNERNLPRATQLLNKTNQMNLTSRRVASGELLRWVEGGERRLWTFRVRDRFGDAGLTGVASVSLEGRTAELADFVLSCRVFGRHVEHAMLHTVVEWAREHGAAQLIATCVPTAKNAPCLRFLETSGLEKATDFRFVWDLAAEYPRPTDLRLRTRSGADVVNAVTYFGPGVTFDHVGMAVASIRDVAGPDVEVIDDPIQRVSVAFVDFAGLRIELIQPLGDGSPIDRTLERGQSLAHLCFRVQSLEQAVARGRQAGLHQLARPMPARAFGGRRIAWLFNRNLGLVELLEDTAPESRAD